MSALFCFFLLFSFSGHSQAADGSFTQGIEAYQQKDFTVAQQTFESLVEAHPNNPTLLYNLGLSEYQLGNLGRALGLWRKARYLAPERSDVEEAIAFTEAQLFPDQQSAAVYMVILNTLHSIPFHVWAFTCLLLLALAGWFSLEYGVKRKLSISLWPSWLFALYPAILFAALFTIWLSFDSFKTRATVVQKDLEVRASPAEESPSLSQLQEGEIVTLMKSSGEWQQVRGKKGSPGWVRSSSLIIIGG